MSFRSPKGTHCLNLIRYHVAYIKNTYCHQPPSIVTQSIRIYDHFRVSPISQSLLLTLAQTLFSQGWECMQYSSLVNHENWLPCIMIHHRSCSVCIIYANGITMGNPSWRPRQVIPPSRRWCTTASTGLPKPWTNYGQLIYLQGTHDLYLLCNS